MVCRLSTAEATGSCKPQNGEATDQLSKGTTPRYPSPTPPSALPPFSSSLSSYSYTSSAAHPSSSFQGFSQLTQQSPERPSSFTHALSQAPASSPYKQPFQRVQSTSAANAVQLSLRVSEASSSVQAILSPTGQSAPAAASETLHLDDASDADVTASVTAAEQQPDESSASSIQMLAEPQGQSLGRQGSQEDLAASEQGVDDAAELQRLLREEKRKTAALISEQLCCSCACDVACPCKIMSALMHMNPKELRTPSNVHHYQVVLLLLIPCLCTSIVKQCNREKNGNWVCQYLCQPCLRFSHWP